MIGIGRGEGGEIHHKAVTDIDRGERGEVDVKAIQTKVSLEGEAERQEIGVEGRIHHHGEM